MKFYNFPWGLYPRRVQIYLAEKGLSVDTENYIPGSPGWPPQRLLDANPQAKLPVLVADNGESITQSLGILAYLEAQFPRRPLNGTTPLEKSRIAEMVSLGDEATMSFGFWVHSASPLFQGREPQSLEAARVGALWYTRRLKQMEKRMELGQAFLAGPSPSLADCVVMPILQLSAEFYGVRIPAAFPRLQAWFEMFSQRDSVTRHEYPDELLQLAHGLETQSGFVLDELVD